MANPLKFRHTQTWAESGGRFIFCFGFHMRVSVICVKYCTCTSFLYKNMKDKKMNDKKGEIYFLIVVCLFVGYTPLRSFGFFLVPFFNGACRFF